LLIGGTWAVCPLLFLKGAPFDIQLTIVFMCMGAAGLGAMVLARLPSAAILHSCLVTAALTASLFQLPARSAAVVAVLAAAFGATLAAVLVQAHRKELQHARQAADSSRQAEIIALLLREFEAGASDWIWETGPDGRLTYVSGRMAQVLKRQRDRLIGATLLQAAGRARRSGSWRQVAATMAGRHVLCETLVPVTVAGKTMWWQLTARPLHAADGTFRGYRGVGKDVTARHQSEINVLKAKEAAERESQSKSQFLAMMSHELRTPLNAIVGFSQILADEKEGPHASRNYAEYAKAIHQSSGHLASLINDILDITRFERGGITLVEQELDLVELAELSVRMCRTTAAENRIELVEKHAFARLEVRGDLTRLRQIVLNLMVNAIKFSPSGGVVTVGVERLPDGRVAVAVADNGIGIEPAKLQHIFEPFAQADSGFARRFGGLGLGLAIARRMARLHGGDILIASAPGNGTLARLVLPTSRVIEEKPRQAKTQEAA
jgi:PAS domain S-box-containing protein